MIVFVSLILIVINISVIFSPFSDAPFFSNYLNISCARPVSMEFNPNHDNLNQKVPQWS